MAGRVSRPNNALSRSLYNAKRETRAHRLKTYKYSHQARPQAARRGCIVCFSAEKVSGVLGSKTLDPGLGISSALFRGAWMRFASTPSLSPQQLSQRRVGIHDRRLHKAILNPRLSNTFRHHPCDRRHYAVARA